MDKKRNVKRMWRREITGTDCQKSRELGKMREKCVQKPLEPHEWPGSFPKNFYLPGSTPRIL